MRTSPIGYVIIDAVSTFAGLFFRRREVTDIAIIIITPDQRDIIGHLQSGIINVEYFLVRYESLRNGGDIFIHILFQQTTLVFKHAFQHSFLFYNSLGSLHLPVVHTTHTQSIDIFLSRHFFHTVFPEFVNGGTVIHIVIIALSPSSPFAGSTTHHRFAMGRTDKNTEFGSYFPITFCQEKGQGTLVHGRPISISPQAEQ